MNSSPAIAVVGSTNVDLHLRVPALPAAGQTLMVTESSTSPGGKGANQAVAAAVSGGDVHFIAAVGEDDKAAETRRSLNARGINTDHVVTTPGPSGQAVVVVADKGENLILVIPGANAHLSPNEATEALQVITPTLVLCQLETPLETVHAALAACPEAIRMLNPAPAPSRRESLSAVLAFTDVLLPNRSELGNLAGRREPRTVDEVDAAVTALDFDGDVVVTLGEDGARVFPRAQRQRPPIHVAPVPSTVVDTSGAGDAFCGALAVAIADGLDLVQATQRAVRFASASTQYVGAQVPPTFALPDLQERP